MAFRRHSFLPIKIIEKILGFNIKNSKVENESLGANNLSAHAGKLAAIKYNME